MKAEAESHGTDQEGVDPWRHNSQRLILRQAVDSVAHLNGNQNRQSHSHRFRSLENIAANSLEFFRLGGALQKVRNLVVAKLGSSGVVEEPVGGATDGSETDIDTNGHVTEKQPGGDQSLFGGPGKEDYIVREMTLCTFICHFIC